MKKGISPVVGAVFLILIVIVLGGMVFIWGRSLVLDNKEQALGEKLCREVEFLVGDFCYENVSVENLGTGQIEDRISIKFSGRNDLAESELYGFLISVDYGAETISIPSLAYSEIEGGVSKSINSNFIKNIEGIERIIVVPKIEVGNNIFVCEGKEKVISWEEMEEC